MYEFLNYLDAKMETPASYGPFHLAAFAIVIAVTIILCLTAKNAKDKTFRRICFITWVILILFETYKQINFSFNYNGGQPYWDYQWYAFPFQLCSEPIYILPFIFLSKEGSVIRKATVSFMSFYVFFAGLAVMFYPGDVFVSTIGIDIQTMVWHGSQVALGMFFMVYYRKDINLKRFLAGIPVFLIMVGTALALDMIVPKFTDETFNMYYISPLFRSTLPLLSSIWGRAPWPVFLCLYLVGYTIAAFLVFAAAYGINKAFRKKKTA